MKHFLNLDDLGRDEVERLFERARALRGRRDLDLLRGKAVALVFFNPSLRTRVSMELAAQELGARAVTLSVGSETWDLEWRDGVRMDGKAQEHVKEAVQVLARYVDCVAVRSFPRRASWAEDREDPILRAFARHSPVPVVNMESCLYHPCQALADAFTIREKLCGGAADRKPGKVVLAWASHPKALPFAVPASFALAVLQMGWDLTIARPDGYDLPPEVMGPLEARAARSGARLEVTADRDTALRGARVVYAKSWGSLARYGDDAAELTDRRERGLDRSWIVDERAMALTDGARFMHCLPVRRNVVVADAVLDSEAAIHLDEAENRLHVQKAVLAELLS